MQRRRCLVENQRRSGLCLPPFEVYGENSNSVCYARNNGNVYAALLDWNGGPITLKALRVGGATLGKVSKVELLGCDVALTFVQDDLGLTVTPREVAQPLAGITNQQLAAGCRVLRITHDKGWINDDDPGAVAPGWMRRCNLGTGDFNNDLTTSDTPGDIWSSSFTGTGVSVIAPKESGAGKIEIQIDGQTRAMADLSTTATAGAVLIFRTARGLPSAAGRAPRKSPCCRLAGVETDGQSTLAGSRQQGVFNNLWPYLGWPRFHSSFTSTRCV
jgi:hypothetical protein